MARDSRSRSPLRRDRDRRREENDGRDRSRSNAAYDYHDRPRRRDGDYRDDSRKHRRHEDGGYGRRRSRDRDRSRSGDRTRDRDDRRTRREENNDNRDDRRREPGPSRHSPPSRRPEDSRSRSPSHLSERNEKEKDKGKPNFNQSGLLAAETKTVKLSDGTKTVLKYHEPPEARKPSLGWRLYVFKGEDQTETLHIQRQSAYLVGRDRALCDIYVEHPSCSKQHAAIQHRQVHEKDEFGGKKVVVKPFIIDLESTNGTLVNGEAIPTARYYELKMSDVIKFGQSNREYVLLHDDV